MLMDPLSASASIAALIGAVSEAAKIIRRLYRAARNAGKLRDEVEFFASQVQFFGSMISHVSSAIDGHFEQYGRSETLERLGPKALKHLAAQCMYILGSIKRAKTQMPSGKTGIQGFIDRFKWLTNAPERDKLCSRMECIKSNLQFILTVVHFEALYHKAQSPNTSEQEVRKLKRQIKDQKGLIKAQMQAIQVLQHRHETQFPEQLLPHEETYVEQSFNMNEILLDIGDDMIEHDISPESSLSDASRDRTHPTGLGEDHARDEDEDNDDNDDDDDDDDGDGNRLPNGYSSNKEPTMPQPLPDRDSTESLPLQVPSSPQQVPPQPQANPNSPSASSANSNLSLQTVKSISSSTSDPPDDKEAHYEAVRSSSNQLALSRRMEHRAEAGYVNQARTTAKVYPQFPENLISHAHAVHLGLEIAPHDEDDQVRTIQTGRRSRQTTIGTTFLAWSPGIAAPARARGFKVLCLVCDHLPVPLIFGESFLNRQRAYRVRIANSGRAER
ncbi:hypothetical protein BP5796_07733 [Coleophoma crateriformis]|uniref:Fungal N-terminal domain-containing protein n=1 Tax=Coleophoma crateriformis TaxID=565419 RepID=A0A3D8RCC2_9HELO|nr:hypothetical protein BP5796_07733 [Coleophoma crateriformis]